MFTYVHEVGKATGNQSQGSERKHDTGIIRSKAGDQPGYAYTR